MNDSERLRHNRIDDVIEYGAHRARKKPFIAHEASDIDWQRASGTQ